GEIDGRGSNDWVSWKATKPDWLRDKKINILVQVGLNKESDLPDVPLLSDLASNAEDRAVLKLLSSPIVLGRPVLTSPDVPPERIAALRRAFDATMRDPNFLAEAVRLKLDIRAVTGEEMQRFVLETIRTTPASVAQRLSSVISENTPAAERP
ncbi:MAG: uncharacterized protein JWL62_2759, partial [Hyphomicrobiales bacterium]|nr:uncharacterized protein [Hyphomicrobiales bacterium]